MVQHSPNPPPACESRANTAYSANNKVGENYYAQWNECEIGRDWTQDLGSGTMLDASPDQSNHKTQVIWKEWEASYAMVQQLVPKDGLAH
jgi:hypothetical protein